MPQDYLHDNDDLKIADGDFVVGESTTQHQSLLWRLNKGELRQYPKTGIGSTSYLLDDVPGDIYAETQKQFEADGMSIRKLDISFSTDGSKLEPNIEAFYR